MELTPEQLATLSSIIKSLRDFLASLAQKLPAPEGSHAIDAPGGSAPSANAWGTGLLRGFVPNPAAPILSMISNRSRPGGVISVAGHQFDDAMQLWVYSEKDGKIDISQATLIPNSRRGNSAKYQVSQTAIADTFWLAWLYHPTHGWSYPIPINAPEAHTLHSSFYGSYSRTNVSDVVARVGDQIRVGGRNLSTACRCYFRPKSGGGTGAWVSSDECSEVRAVFTVPNLPIGKYEVWVHSGSGGEWGWAECSWTLAIEAAEVLGAVRIAPPPSGGNDSEALKAIANNIPGNSGAYVQLQSGTYLIDTAIGTARGGNFQAHFRGQPDGSTILKAVGNSAFFSGNTRQWIENINFDITNWTNAIGAIATVTGAASRVINCTVTSTDGAFTVFQRGGWGTGAYRVDGCTFRTALCSYGVCVLNNGWMSNSTLINNNNAEAGIYSNGGKYNVALDNVKFSDDGENTGGGRAYVAEYANRGLSIVGCTTTGLKVSGDQNRGEQILVDGGFVRYAFYASGGTKNTISLSPASVNNGTRHARTTAGSSANAASTPCLLNFPGVGNTSVISHVDIVSGANTVAGRYAITSRTASSVTLAGSIGSTASLANVVAEGIAFYGTSMTLSSSNANSAAPIVKGFTFDSTYVGHFLCFSGSGGAIETWAKITSVSGGAATLDRPISGSETVANAIARFFLFAPSAFGGNGALSAVVVGGKGESQFAEIVSASVSSSGDLVLNLDRPFRVPTDSTSFVKLGHNTMDAVIYGNTLRGNGGQVTANSGASCGFESFGPTTGFTVRKNTIRGLHYGIVDLVYNARVNQGCWSLWNDFSDNTITDCGFGARIWSMFADYGQTISLSHSVWEDITISGTSDMSSPYRTAQIWSSQWDSASEVTLSNVQASGNSAFAISTQNATGGTYFFVGCSISIGSGTFSGSRVITSGSPFTVHQYAPASGQFVGFQS